MTMLISPLLEESYAAAVELNRFFTEKEKTFIRYLEQRERSPFGCPSKSCDTNLFFGFFFDGTKNNYEQAELKKNHSNVARLYDCFPGESVLGVLPLTTDWTTDKSKYQNFYRVYVPGVASPFPQVGDSGTGWHETSGAATGMFGDFRIVWALIQAINNVHRYFLKEPLIPPPEAKELARALIINKNTRALLDGRPVLAKLSSREEKLPQKFKEILLRLHGAVSAHWPNENTGKPAKIGPGIVKNIYISTFGFSRGATAARVFTNWLQSLCKLDARMRGKKGSMSLGGFPVQFDFLGLFDTVASVGSANSFCFFDGHGFWADAEDSLRIPPGMNCLHLIAAHELRRSFPVDSISVNGILPSGCTEIVVPGVHSDVGCGYYPGEQGRGTDPAGADMLARIPLLMMYKAARLNGVPLKLELASKIAKGRFALAPEAIQAFNAYIATCSEKQGPLHRIMREQARKQMEWRLARRVSGAAPLDRSPSFLRASMFDRNDLHSAALEFEEEIDAFATWLREKGKQFKPSAQKAGFDNSHAAEWEEIATWWGKEKNVHPAVLEFFDHYVHDSRAWFKLIPGNPDNEGDMRAMLDDWIRKRKRVASHNQIRTRMHGRGNSIYRMHARDGLTEDERRAVEEYQRSGKIPRMPTTGREPWGSATDMIACAGYLRYRKVYAGSDSDLIS